MSLSTIKRILTLTCEQSTRLVSESLDRDLPRGERWAVRLHALCCRSCRRYRRQILFLREAVRRGAPEPDTSTPVAGASLTPGARERIKRALGRHTSG